MNSNLEERYQDHQQDERNQRAQSSQSLSQLENLLAEWFPVGWEISEDNIIRMPIKELRQALIHFDGESVNYRRWKQWVSAQIHHNVALNTIQRTSIICETIPAEVRDIVGAYPTSEKQAYKDLLKALSETFDSDIEEAYIQTISQLPMLEKSKPHTITKMVGLLKKAQCDLEGNAKALLAPALRKMGDYGSLFQIRYPRGKQSIKAIAEFLSSEYQLLRMCEKIKINNKILVKQTSI